MIQISNTENGDFCEVLELINHVFGKENCSLKMEDVFTDLLSKNNMEHLRIVKVDGKPVSVINYITNEIDIKGCIIKAANIGAVCTHEDYRGRGYSNLILKDCLNKMKNEGVDFLYVSGKIGLYTKNNIHITGKMHHFNIDRNYINKHTAINIDECEVKECSKEDIHLLSALYDAEAVKFIRNKQRFLDLAGRVPGVSVFNNASKIFCVMENDQIQGYFICGIFQKENGASEMEVIEYAGKRKAILAGIIKTMVQLDSTSISGYAPWFDADMVRAFAEYEIKAETCNYPGAMRIINFTQLMQKLKPLFAQEINLESIEFCEAHGKYIIRSGSIELAIDNDKTMHDLFLGNISELFEIEHTIGNEMLLNMLKLALPIPVPYPYSLNYI